MPTASSATIPSCVSGSGLTHKTFPIVDLGLCSLRGQAYHHTAHPSTSRQASTCYISATFRSAAWMADERTAAISGVLLQRILAACTPLRCQLTPTSTITTSLSGGVCPLPACLSLLFFQFWTCKPTFVWPNFQRLVSFGESSCLAACGLNSI